MSCGIKGLFEIQEHTSRRHIINEIKITWSVSLSVSRVVTCTKTRLTCIKQAPFFNVFSTIFRIICLLWTSLSSWYRSSADYENCYCSQPIIMPVLKLCLDCREFSLFSFVLACLTSRKLLMFVPGVLHVNSPVISP